MSGAPGLIATTFGLEAVADKTLRGEHRGAMVEVRRSGQRTTTYDVNTGRSDTMDSRKTVIEAPFSPPLRLGFFMRSHGRHDPKRDGTEPRRTFQIGVTDGDSFDAFLDAAGIDDALRSLARPMKIEITDSFVRTEETSFVTDVAIIRAGLDAVANLATRLSHARAQHPPAWEPALADSWARVAAAWGLTFDPRTLTIHGTTRGHTVHVTVGPKGRETTLWTGLPAPLGCQLVITRLDNKDAITKLFLKLDDIRLGDPVFDDAVWVRGYPQTRVREVLHAKARSKLMALLAAGDRVDGVVSVDDRSVKLVSKGLVVSPDMLDHILKATFAAADALSPDLAPDAGPFR